MKGGAGLEEGGHVASLWWPLFRLRVMRLWHGDGGDEGLTGGDVEDGGVVLPGAAGGPAVLVEGGRVVQVSAAARAGGVRLGMTPADARSSCAGVGLWHADGDRVAAVMGALLGRAVELLGPVVEGAGPGMLHVRAGVGEESDPSWQVRAGLLGARLPELGGADLGEPRVGFAADRFTARAVCCRLAREGEPVHVPPGAERAVLAGLDVGLLPLGAEERAGLRELGVRTLGDFAAVGEEALARRFGERARGWLRMATGAERRPLLPWRGDERPTVERVLVEGQWEEAAVLWGVFMECAGELLSWLEGRGVQAERVEVELRGRGEVLLREALCPASPTVLASTFGGLFRERIGRVPLRGGVDVVALRGVPTGRPLGGTGSLFGVFGRDPVRLRTALERLERDCPGVRASGVALHASHWPEERMRTRPPEPERLLGEGEAGVLTRAGRVQHEEQSGPGSARPARETGAALPLTDSAAGEAPDEGEEEQPLARAYRLFRPPRPVAVRCGEQGPVSLRLDGGWALLRDVEGPVVVNGGWWEEARMREYWDGWIPGRGRLRLFHVPWPAGWFVEGCWD